MALRLSLLALDEPDVLAAAADSVFLGSLPSGFFIAPSRVFFLGACAIATMYESESRFVLINLIINYFNEY